MAHYILDESNIEGIKKHIGFMVESYIKNFCFSPDKDMQSKPRNATGNEAGYPSLRLVK